MRERAKRALKASPKMEVADFNDKQIFCFVSAWFAAKNSTIVNRFIQKLKANEPIRELATNPLLLTLLCLTFEEFAELPLNRSQLYKEGLNILLKKWDDKLNIERQQIYKKLSVQHKEDLLSKIALLTFERGDYFFTQTELQHYIACYISNLPGVSTQVETLQLESVAVLKSIEAQHGLLVERASGIYSFSHVMFHEYFVARGIVDSSDPQTLEMALKQLVIHISEYRWREVFFLTVVMLRKSDYMLHLMKQKIDDIATQNEQLQALLTWASRKVRTVSVCYKPVSVRAFYFELAVARVLAFDGSWLDLTKALDYNFTPHPEPSLALDLALYHTLSVASVVDFIFEPNRDFERILERAIAYAHNVEPMLERSLQQLKEQLPEDRDGKKFQQWWQANNGDWTKQLRKVMIKHRHIGYDWHFSAQEMEALKQYYDANQLLADCLNTNLYVTRKARWEIEETLLLPTKEISLPLG